jgi:ribosomal protein S18 acetylase RimI-like enzyme
MIEYRMSTEAIDWAEMKSVLVADNFDNDRTPEQYRQSFENSYAVCIALDEGRLIGTARVLSDGVCNAYIVDVWTLSAYRRQGIARTMIERLLERLPGQHVYLFTDDQQEFYRRIGFTARGAGMERVVGEWLKG